MNANVAGMVRSIVEYSIASALFQAGRRDEARERVEKAKAEFNDDGGILTAMQALFFALEGDKVRADEKIRESILLGEGFGHFHHTTHVIASAHALMDEPGLAMDWLNYTVENGYPNLPRLEQDPHLDKLRGDPRFIALLAKIRKRFERYQALAKQFGQN